MAATIEATFTNTMNPQPEPDRQTARPRMDLAEKGSRRAILTSTRWGGPGHQKSGMGLRISRSTLYKNESFVHDNYVTRIS